MPESKQNEVLNFIEHLKRPVRNHKKVTQDSEWEKFSLKSAMRGIEEEPGPYEEFLKIQEKLDDY
jgi:SET domain-containing protein